MSYNGICLYPFEKLPDVGIATSDQTTESEYLQYADAIQLSDEDQAILQAIYIWIQAYYRTIVNEYNDVDERDIPFVITTYPSYSELWWLTRLFKKLFHSVWNIEEDDYDKGKKQIKKHRKLYTDAMKALGQSYWLSEHTFHTSSNTRFRDFKGLSYGTIKLVWFGDKVCEIAGLLTSNSAFTKDFHDLSVMTKRQRMD